MIANQREPLKICGDRDAEFPVQAFFNAISDDSLLDIIGHLVKCQGAGINDCLCLFPGDLDPNDSPFEGVRFSLRDEDVVITLAQFAEWLDHISTSYSHAHPRTAHRMKALVQGFRQSLRAQTLL